MQRLPLVLRRRCWCARPPSKPPLLRWLCAASLVMMLGTGSVSGQQPPAAASADAETVTLASALGPQAWETVERSIERALAWLGRQQGADGSFHAPAIAQPAATSLAVMAFISKGHMPGEGPYGAQIDRAIDFVLTCQRSDGLLAAAGGGAQTNYQVSNGAAAGKTANYNHGIAGVMLTEVYGTVDRARSAKLKPAILKALEFSRRTQTLTKVNPVDAGGWRYLNYQSTGDSDLSVTSWQLMFYRSAKNAEFEVPKQYADEAVGYVLRCWDERQGIFYYKRSGYESRWSRGMVGAGILSLALGGHHDTKVAKRAGDWLLSYPFRQFGESVGSGDRFFYSAYYCSQAMAQLGGRHWKQFFPQFAAALLHGQQPSGEWPAEPYSNDRIFGNTYTTALAVLALTPPLQLLPVYQR